MHIMKFQEAYINVCMKVYMIHTYKQDESIERILLKLGESVPKKMDLTAKMYSYPSSVQRTS